MIKKYKTILLIYSSSALLVFTPLRARADLFGGDVAVLLQILAQAIQQVTQLQMVLQNGKDTLGLLRDINSGARSGLDLIRIVNPKFSAGVYGDLRDPQSVLRAIQDMYGQVPQTADRDVLEAQDQSVAEVISMNRNLYDYADRVDVERDRILLHAQVVSPQGAAKLQNQSLAVLIGVMTQLLRTQSQMLKIMGQNMALENRREKLGGEEFIQNYQGLSDGFKQLPTDIQLPTIKQGGE